MKNGIFLPRQLRLSNFRKQGYDNRWLKRYKIFYFSLVGCKVMVKRRVITYTQVIFDIYTNSFIQTCNHSKK